MAIATGAEADLCRCGVQNPSLSPINTAGFRRSLPDSLLASLSGLVRAMNCYYSNLIEGHATHPIDIELALRVDYNRDARKRDLQLEARAHIAVSAPAVPRFLERYEGVYVQLEAPNCCMHV